MKKNYVVYLLHFDKPYWKTCRHYVGYTGNLQQRLNKHITGTGSKLVAYAVKKGNIFDPVQILSNKFNYLGDPISLTKKEARQLELKYKRTKNLKHYCRYCTMNPIPDLEKVI